VNYLPWVLFGLLGGAVLDRVDRKRAMVIADVVRGAIIFVIPALAAVGDLSLLWIYLVVFGQACMQVIFSSGQFTAAVALVDKDRLVRANSLIEASYSGATVAGSGIAGLMFSVLPIADALYVDGLSFFVSAASLLLVRRSFNEQAPAGLRFGSMRALFKTLAADTKDGLAYVWHHPVLRSLSLQLMIVNLFGSAATAELALFATQRLGADNSQVGYLYGDCNLNGVTSEMEETPDD
jgi:MFS family permease